LPELPDARKTRDMALLDWHMGEGRLEIAARGAWTIDSAATLDRAVADLPLSGAASVRLDLDRVDWLDTAGAWTVQRLRRRCEEAGLELQVAGIADKHRMLLDQVGRAVADYGATRPAPERARGPLGRLGASVSAGAAQAARDGLRFLAYLGDAVECLARVVTGRCRFPLTSLVHHMQEIWLKALFIVGFLTFVIGGVITYNGAGQLEQFRAEIYAINLIALAMLREVGVVIAALVMAGRTGSAYTAELGAMTIRNEINAMRTVGIEPMAVLVLPRVLAAIVAFPFLVFFGDVMGLLGGALAAWIRLDVTPQLFVERFADIVNMDMFAAGFIKAPVLAAAVALVGCYQGLAVRGGPDELGRQTTRAVVQAIFLVLLLDALFSVFLGYLGI
jgi:phospholipid/cholesterol/gamma-HCH transport system permease protein